MGAKTHSNGSRASNDDGWGKMDFEKIFIEHWLHFLLTALTTGLSAIVLNLRKKFIKQQNRERATEQGVKALLRNEIIKTYNHYMDKGYMPIHERDNLGNLYDQYKNLGGNGTIPALIDELLELPVREIPGTRGV